MAYATALHSHKCAICNSDLPCTVSDCAYRGTRVEGEWTCFLCKGMVSEVNQAFQINRHKKERLV